MADDTRDTGGEAEEQRPSIGEQAEEIVEQAQTAGESQDDVEARLVATDSGDLIGHEEVVEGLAHELRAQDQVIDLLSEQREPEGVNIAKVLDSSQVDIDRLMATRVDAATAEIIGPNAARERRDHIRQEITLPMSTAFSMCAKSVLVRIGRVAITGSGIFLGIAFYASVSVTALILHAAAQTASKDATIAAAAAEAADAEHARQVWLIVMALLVSVVGICNSMLMAVAERFREIGTMKCLGALDHFIVRLFMIESGILGLLAGFAGAIVGGGLMYLVNSWRYEFEFTGEVGLGLVKILVVSVVLGTVLSMLAAIMPAKQAAKMPAAAALRTDV